LPRDLGNVGRVEGKARTRQDLRVLGQDPLVEKKFVHCKLLILRVVESEGCVPAGVDLGSCSKDAANGDGGSLLIASRRFSTTRCPKVHVVVFKWRCRSTRCTR